MELTKKQWDFVMKKLSEPPTEEQKRRAKQAIENARKMKTYYEETP